MATVKELIKHLESFEENAQVVDEEGYDIDIDNVISEIDDTVNPSVPLCIISTNN